MHRVRRLSKRLASLPHCHRGGTLLLWTTVDGYMGGNVWLSAYTEGCLRVATVCNSIYYSMGGMGIVKGIQPGHPI